VRRANTTSTMSGAGDWCLIESDPAVFTELLEKFGVSGAQLEEIYCMDDQTFESLQPIHGLVFLFKIDKDQYTAEQSKSVVSPPANMFFAKQVINNACATQALLSLLLNVKHEDLKLGDTLTEFKEFTKDFDPALRGLSLSNCDAIRTVHNSFARQTLFEIESKVATKDDDLYHFIGYMPYGGRVYEMDGLQDGPIDHGAVGAGQSWLEVARPVIARRMEAAGASGEIRFNLMALTSDRAMLCERRLAAGGDPQQMREATEALALERERRARWQAENVRRRHNYLPLIVRMLQMLAERGRLMPVYEAAKKRGEEVEKSKKSRAGNK